MSGEQCASMLEDILPNVSLLAQLRSEPRHMQERLELAKQSYDKMIVYAPNDHESKRVMNVARHFDTSLGEKYHRLTIEHPEE